MNLKQEHTDAEFVRVAKDQLIPLVVFLYDQAELEVPWTWDAAVEGPRLVAALQAQGFTARFGTDETTDRRRRS